MNKLFEHCKIGGLELPNRVIMTALSTGMEFETLKGFLRERAKGGAAYITTVMGISILGTPSNMMLLEKNNMDKVKELADEIHRNGGKIFIQLFHCGRNIKKELMMAKDENPVAPSPIASPIFKEMPRQLEVAEIEALIHEFGQAATICKEAGIDGVEISCSAGYLLSEFFSTLTNKRMDTYGGSFENRCRFPIEVMEEIRHVVGKNYPVILRVSAEDMVGGYGIKETIALVQKGQRWIDGVNVTGGWHESRVPQISMQLEEGGFAYLAKQIKELVDIPVIACNRINNGEVAKKLIEEGYCDFVGCARAFLVEPDFGNKVREGKYYRRCMACNQGCIGKVLKGEQLTCILNPKVGFEREA